MGVLGNSSAPQLFRIGVLVAALALVTSVGVGLLSYWVSRETTLESLHRSRLRMVRTLAAEYEYELHQGDEPRVPLTELRRIWGASEKRFRGSQLLVIRGNATLALHSEDVGRAGAYVGDVHLRPEEPGDPETFRDLIAARRDWVGVEIDPTGAEWLIAGAHIEKPSTLVALRAPMEEVDAEIRAEAAPWALGLGALTLILFAMGLGVVHQVHARGQRALRRSETRLRAILESEPECVKIISDEGTLLEMNSAGLHMLEAENLKSLLGRCIFPLVAPEYQEAFQEFTRRVCAGHRETLEFDMISLKGHRRRLESFAVPFCSEPGEPVRLLSITRDITERRQAEAESLQLRTAIEQSAEAVMITDTEGRIEYVNPAFIRNTGYTREEVLGQNPRLLRSGQHDEPFYEELWRTIKGGESWQGTVVNRRKDGSFFTEWMTITPVRDPGGAISHFIAIKEDVTERRKLEEQLRLAQRMEAVGQLAGGVAHDFNNMLMVIKGYTELLLDKLEAGNPLRHYATEAAEAAEKAAAITRQLLAFSRQQPVQHTVFDLNAAVRTAENLLGRLIGEDIELVTKLDPELGLVKADPGQLEQVIINLAVNARDAMPQGGQLTMETRNVELDEQYSRNHLSAPPGLYALLAVTDTGMGMDKETQAHIFEPFFTTKEKGKGTGLGLATVYGIIKQSGGYIWVYSEPGQGTTFKVYLPRVAEQEETDQAGEVPAEAPAPRQAVSQTVLLVEDQAPLRHLIRMHLEDMGLKVLEAGSAAEALKVARAHEGPISLLLTDVILPGINGRVLAEQLAAQRPALKVLYASGYPDETIAHHGVLEPGVHFLQKPFTKQALAKKVSALLGLNAG